MTYKLSDSILGKIKGSFICIINGKETVYENPNDLMSQAFDKNYIIASIEAKNNQIVITLKENDIIPNDLNADWAKEHMEKTGKEISFF